MLEDSSVLSGSGGSVKQHMYGLSAYSTSVYCAVSHICDASISAYESDLALSYNILTRGKTCVQ